MGALSAGFLLSSAARLYKQHWYLYRALHTIAAGRCVPHLSAWVLSVLPCSRPCSRSCPVPSILPACCASRGYSQLMPVNSAPLRRPAALNYG